MFISVSESLLQFFAHLYFLKYGFGYDVILSEVSEGIMKNIDGLTKMYAEFSRQGRTKPLNSSGSSRIQGLRIILCALQGK